MCFHGSQSSLGAAVPWPGAALPAVAVALSNLALSILCATAGVTVCSKRHSFVVEEGLVVIAVHTSQ